MGAACGRYAPSGYPHRAEISGIKSKGEVKLYSNHKGVKIELS